MGAMHPNISTASLYMVVPWVTYFSSLFLQNENRPLLQIRRVLHKYMFKEQIRGREDCLTKHLESRKMLVYGDLKTLLPTPVFSCVLGTMSFQAEGLILLDGPWNEDRNSWGKHGEWRRIFIFMPCKIVQESRIARPFTSKKDYS